MSDLLPVVPAFLVAVLVIAATPGPAVALIVRRAAVHGWRRAVPLVVGIEAGLFVWAVLAATGLAALLAVSEVAYLVLRVAGAAVLCYLGVQALRAAWAAHREARELRPAAAGPPTTTAPLPSTRRAFAEGLATNLANPKLAVFMIAFFPQFIPAGAAVLPATLALAALQVTVELALYTGFAIAVGRAGAFLASPRVRARLEAVSGTILLGLGLRVALLSR